jgi:hypothetical protein
MDALVRIIGILAIGGSFLVFTSMNTKAADMSTVVPPPLSVPESPRFPAPALPKPMPSFSGPGGTGNAYGGLVNAPGGSPGGGTSGASGSGIH